MARGVIEFACRNLSRVLASRWDNSTLSRVSLSRESLAYSAWSNGGAGKDIGQGLEEFRWSASAKHLWRPACRTAWRRSAGHRFQPFRQSRNRQIPDSWPSVRCFACRHRPPLRRSPRLEHARQTSAEFRCFFGNGGKTHRAAYGPGTLMKSTPRRFNSRTAILASGAFFVGRR